MHNLFFVYFVNLYMFRASLDPSSGGTTYVYNNWYLLFFLVDCIISTNCCIHTVIPPDDGPRYARNMQKMTKYTRTKNKLCVKLVFLYTIVSRCTLNKTKKYRSYVAMEAWRITRPDKGRHDDILLWFLYFPSSFLNEQVLNMETCNTITGFYG